MNSLKGHLLIATPELVSPFFTRSVILMLDHSEEAAMGVILNHATDATVSDIAEKIFEQSFEWEKPLHLGGPVTGPLLLLHAVEEQSDEQILPGIFHTYEASKVQNLIRSRAEPSLVIANYSGWGPGQLESELDLDSWLTLPATFDHVFWTKPKDLWEVVVQAVSARKLSEFLGVREVPPDPTLN